MTEPPSPPTTLDPGRAALPPRTDLDPGRGAPPPTALDPERGSGAGSGSGSGQGDDEWGDGRLPRALATRYRLVRELPGGSEAQLFLVTDVHQRHESVLKLYRPGLGPDPEVRQALARLSDEQHLVRYVEQGTTAGRVFEVMEHLAGGSLDDLVRQRGPLPSDTVREIVQQVASALGAMHAEGVPHRDIKPGNILLRTQEPLDLAVIDFGITRRTDGTVMNDTNSGTPSYMAPEQWAGELSPAIDWWALGMTVLKLCTGEHPFEHLDGKPALINKQIITRDVDLSEVPDPWLSLLLRGLLTRDPEDRWGAEQVRLWSAGETPEVVSPAAGETQYSPYDLHGIPVTGRIQLGTLLADEWDEAAARYFTAEGARPAWPALAEWLRGLRGDTKGRDDLLAELARPGDPDVKLLRLVRWLDPGQPPIFRTENLTPDRLAALAERAVGDVPGYAPGLVFQLWEHGLLPQLSMAPRGRGLAEADTRWRELYVAWRGLTRALGESHPPLAEPLESLPPRHVLPYLLWLATSEQRAVRALRAAGAGLRAELPHPVAWVTRLTRPDAPPLELLAALLLEGVARADAAELDAARRHRAWLLREESVHEWYRGQERPIALGWAACGACLVAAAWTWLIEFSDLVPLASTTAVMIAWLCAVLLIVIVLGAELTLAAAIGGPYHSRYSLVGALIRQGRRVGQPIAANGWLGIGLFLAAGAGLILITAYLPPLLPLSGTAAHIGWTMARYQRWTRDEAERAAEIEQARRERRPESQPESQPDTEQEGVRA